MRYFGSKLIQIKNKTDSLDPGLAETDLPYSSFLGVLSYLASPYPLCFTDLTIPIPQAYTLLSKFDQRILRADTASCTSTKLAFQLVDPIEQ